MTLASLSISRADNSFSANSQIQALTGATNRSQFRLNLRLHSECKGGCWVQAARETGAVVTGHHGLRYALVPSALCLLVNRRRLMRQHAFPGQEPEVERNRKNGPERMLTSVSNKDELENLIRSALCPPQARIPKQNAGRKLV